MCESDRLGLIFQLFKVCLLKLGQCDVSDRFEDDAIGQRVVVGVAHDRAPNQNQLHQYSRKTIDCIHRAIPLFARLDEISSPI